MATEYWWSVFNKNENDCSLEKIEELKKWILQYHQRIHHSSHEEKIYQQAREVLTSLVQTSFVRKQSCLLTPCIEAILSLPSKNTRLLFQWLQNDSKKKKTTNLMDEMISACFPLDFDYEITNKQEEGRDKVELSSLEEMDIEVKIGMELYRDNMIEWENAILVWYKSIDWNNMTKEETQIPMVWQSRKEFDQYLDAPWLHERLREWILEHILCCHCFYMTAFATFVQNAIERTYRHFYKTIRMVPHMKFLVNVSSALHTFRKEMEDCIRTKRIVSSTFVAHLVTLDSSDLVNEVWYLLNENVTLLDITIRHVLTLERPPDYLIQLIAWFYCFPTLIFTSEMTNWLKNVFTRLRRGQQRDDLLCVHPLLEVHVLAMTILESKTVEQCTALLTSLEDGITAMETRPMQKQYMECDHTFLIKSPEELCRRHVISIFRRNKNYSVAIGALLLKWMYLQQKHIVH